jgi:tetratricopeptide (TPR) repeat protein
MENSNEINLSFAEKLFYLGDVIKALEVLTKLEEGKEISPNEQCSIYILKSKIYNILGEYNKELQSLDKVYQISQKLDDTGLIIDVLLLKVEKAIVKGEKETYFELIGKIEKLFEENRVVLHPKLGDIYLSKGRYFYIIEGDLTQSLRFFNESSKIYKKNNDKQKLADVFIEIARIMFHKGELEKAMDNFKNSLKLSEEIGYKRGIVTVYNGFGILFSFTEDEPKSLMYLKKCLVIAEQINYKYMIATSMVNIGEMLSVQGDLKGTERYYEKSLKIYQELQNIGKIGYVLLYLIILYIEMDSNEKIKEIFSHLEKLYNQHHNKFKEIDDYFLVAKALKLKKSPRMRDKVKAEEIFKEFVIDGSIDFQLTIIALLNWCELLLAELSINNDPDVLKEIQPIIDKLLLLEEQQYNYKLIAKTHLLQAKLALIQFELKEAQQFLTQAQQIAQEKGLQLLAMKISAEHDEILNNLGIWENLQKNQNQISMAERFKYAKMNEQMNSMIRIRVPEQQELLSEKPIFLSIITKGGIPLIKFPFMDKWAKQKIFSGFITAFNVFSKQLFSKSVDRVKMGEYIIILKSIEPFTACYVIEGASYLAQQKLTKFSNKIRTTSEIWDQLIESNKTGELISTKRNKHLKTIINEIFAI